MTEPSSENTEKLLTFPTFFPLKIIGNNTETFADDVGQAICLILPEFNPATFVTEYSKTKKYLSLTATVFVSSQEELDAIYRALHAIKDVKFLL